MQGWKDCTRHRDYRVQDQLTTTAVTLRTRMERILRTISPSDRFRFWSRASRALMDTEGRAFEHAPSHQDRSLRSPQDRGALRRSRYKMKSADVMVIELPTSTIWKSAFPSPL